MGRTALLILCLASVPACASVFPRPFQIDRLNRELGGRVIDLTRNHGVDRRLFSRALGEKRDMYVYVPPNYDPRKQYPLAIVLHGFRQDERRFLADVIRPLDAAILNGKLPPVILACPDGTPYGTVCLYAAGTFFLNSKLGAFEDYLVQDVYPYMLKNYPVRPEREAHALLGISMGGGAAFAKAIKYREHFGIAAALFPPVNLRYESCRGRYMDNFDPSCQRLRTDFTRGWEPVGRFYGGLITIRQGQVVNPLYGRNNPLTAELVAANNPLEMIDLYQLKPGEVQFFLGYGGKDEFNIDAQVESFLQHARKRGIEVEVAYDPEGRHNLDTALKLLPSALEWLRPRLEPYAPK